MKRVLFTFIILSAILIVFLNTEQFNLYINSVFGKLEDFSHRSTAARFASITVNIRVFFENPLLGIGFNNLAEVFPYYALQRTGFLVEDNTNMILIQFASHGLIYGSLWVLGYWKTSRKMAYNLKKKNSKSALFFIVFMILFVGANLTWGFITYVLLFYGYISYSNEFRNDISSGKLDSKIQTNL